MTYRKKMIEVALPLDAINAASVREKSIRHGHPSTLHLWWARRPLAACRAILFAQLVDDPSAWPDHFTTEAEQDTERERLFELMKQLVTWEASADARILNAARLEIARSFARARVTDGQGDERDRSIMDEEVQPSAILEYLAAVVPLVLDPFAGGGSIPLEAQRLGLRSLATDLNPVAVLINRALTEIPPKFAGQEPVGPLATTTGRGALRRKWPGPEGLAEDIRRYGAWMQATAKERIGHLFPDVKIPVERGEGHAPVIAWLWARTVETPNPAFPRVHVPLVASFWLSKKPSRPTWVETVFSEDRRSFKFAIRTGEGGPSVKETVNRKGATCLASGQPIPFSYIRDQAKAGRLGARLMAVVAEGDRQRLYISPTDEMERLAESASPKWMPSTDLPSKALGFRVQQYGMTRHADLFTSRQLVALSTFSRLAKEVRDRVVLDALAAGRDDDPTPLHEGGTGAAAYADAIGTYLGLAISRYANAASTLCTWNPGKSKEDIRFTFSRQALPMTWDFAEGSPFSSSSGNFGDNVQKWIYKAVRMAPAVASGRALQRDAAAQGSLQVIASTDPPYYDNVPYADLSDFFYVWLRAALRDIHSDLFGTLLVPKADELIAEPARHGGRSGAEKFFESGMSRALTSLASQALPDVPVTVYYAFKQSETSKHGTSSTGWETFLQATHNAGFTIVGTWPLATERAGRTRDIGSNALASSVVLVCRKRAESAPSISRARFRRLLRAELPAALRALEKGNIAPVDMAQAAIGPGIGVFSRHSQVLEADDQPMTIRAALQMVNEVVDELRGEEEGVLDAETRFAITWFETHGFNKGAYGDAEVLATARAVSVEGVAEAGICISAGGRVQLIDRANLPAYWDPRKDNRPTVWEATQHLIKRLDEHGEQDASVLFQRIEGHKTLGPHLESARLLAYRLYTVCERKGWAQEAGAYNRLVIAWPEVARLSAGQPNPSAGAQQELL